MNQLKIIYRGIEYQRQYPSCYDEMSAEQLTAVTYAMDHFTGPTRLQRILFIWLKLKSKIFLNISVAEMDDLYKTLAFLFEEKIQANQLIIKKFYLHGHLYYGPGEMFRDLQVGEFAYADKFLQDYLKTKSTTALDCLIAVLFRTSSISSLIKNKIHKSDIRRKFNDRLIEKHAKKIHALPIHTRTAILYNFLAFRNSIQAQNKKLFEAEEGSGSGSDLGWAGIIHTLAGDKLGTIDKVVVANFKNTLMMLKKMHQDAANIKEQLTPPK